MIKRIEAGTDVAMIGAWDASRGGSPLAKGWGREYDRTLDRDATEGHVLLIHTGADCGGPIDVYVDAEVPEATRKITKRIEGEFLLRVPTGRLVVGGVEDYRSAKPRITGEDSIISIPSGDYCLRCHLGQEDEAGGLSLPEAEANAISTEDRAYYHSFRRRDNRRAIYILLPMLLFPALWPWLGWKIALAIAIGVWIMCGNLLARHWERQPADARWKRINETLREAMLAGQSPMFVLELRRVTGTTGLKGGSIRL